jgi:hypothetical protein
VQGGVLLDSPATLRPGSTPWVGVLTRDGRSADGWAEARLAPGPGGRGWVVAQWATAADGRREPAGALTPGDAVEFGADYRRRRGRFRSEVVPHRWHGVVFETHPEHVVVWGPLGGRTEAWDTAQRALELWRRRRHVEVPGVTDVPDRAPVPRSDPRQELPESGADGKPGSTVRIDDPHHGTLVVDAEAFGSGMQADRGDLAERLAALAPDLALTGDESLPVLAALAALAARHAPAGPDAGLAPAATPGAVYLGRPDGTVVRRDHEGERLLCPPRKWTPDGFGWGHDGDGARELSFALLTDATGSPEVGRRLTDEHVDALVSRLPTGRGWSLSVADVREWAAGRPVDVEPTPCRSASVAEVGL